MKTQGSSPTSALRLLACAAIGLGVMGPASAQDWRPANPGQVQPASAWRSHAFGSPFHPVTPVDYESPAETEQPSGEAPAELRPEPEATPWSPSAVPGVVSSSGCSGACGGTCGSCACECQPRWYGGVEVVWLDRSRPKPFSVSVLDISPPPETIVLNTEDIGFRYEPGLRLTLGRWLDACTSIEAQYLGLHDWEGTASSPFSAAGDIDPFWGNDLEDIDTRNFQDAFQHEIRYESNLHSFEINRRRWNGMDSSRFVGVRYVQVSEEFELLSFDSDPSGIINPEDFGLYDIDTMNHLIGVHVGGMRQTGGDRFKVGIRGKAGLFLNFLSQESHLLDFNAGNTPPARTDLETRESDVALATVVELGAYGLYRVSDRCWIRAGYDLLFISGLALASEQLDIPQWENSRSSLSDNGSVIYHGPSAGLMFNW